MPVHPHYIEELVYKFNTGSITKEELTILLDWYNHHDDEHVIISTTKEESHDDVKARMLKGILSTLTPKQVEPEKRRLSLPWLSAVAAVLALAFGTWLSTDRKTPVKQEQTAQAIIAPGGNKATLTLANGNTIALSAKQNGIIAGREITYTNGAPVTSAPNSINQANANLTLQTPRGGTYSITLSDGTKVWLNAATTMRYPSNFSGRARVVELEGEAYFEVKSIYQDNGEKMPFTVIAKNQEIAVLGTHFNLSAYPNQATKTTLVEGRVAVNDGRKRVVISPDEQAITQNGKTSVKKVEAGNYTAWREGKFNFNGKTFEETMNDIGRWYDLDIVYENGLPNADLVGDAYRNQNFGLVLRLLDVAQVDYKLNTSNRILTIK